MQKTSPACFVFKLVTKTCFCSGLAILCRYKHSSENTDDGNSEAPDDINTDVADDGNTDEADEEYEFLMKENADKKESRSEHTTQLHETQRYLKNF